MAPQAERPRARNRREGDPLVARGAAARDVRLGRWMRRDRRRHVARGTVTLGRVVILVTARAVEARRDRERQSLRVTPRAVDVQVRSVRERERASGIARPYGELHRAHDGERRDRHVRRGMAARARAGHGLRMVTAPAVLDRRDGKAAVPIRTRVTRHTVDRLVIGMRERRPDLGIIDARCARVERSGAHGRRRRRRAIAARRRTHSDRDPGRGEHEGREPNERTARPPAPGACGVSHAAQIGLSVPEVQGRGLRASRSLCKQSGRPAPRRTAAVVHVGAPSSISDPSGRPTLSARPASRSREREGCTRHGPRRCSKGAEPP
jgi:hypothetical protein